MLTASEPLSTPRSRGRLVRGAGLALAAAAYIVFWVLALTLWSGARSIDMSPQAVVGLYGGAPFQATITLIFSEGLAAVPLLIVLVAIGRTVSRRGAIGAGRVVVATGVAAVAVSLTECAIGLVLALGAAPAHDAAASGLLFDALNRLDGVKMLLLAACALAGSVGPAWRVRALPLWLRVVGIALAVAIVASGIGYVFLIAPLAMAAYASLPLLLLWVSGSGVVLAWREVRGTVPEGSLPQPSSLGR